MNSWQDLRQLVYLARALTWSGGGKLFAPQSVVVSKNLQEVLGARLSPPVCVFAPGDSQTDPEHGQEPGLEVRTFQMIVIGLVPADVVGSAVLMGANRAAATAGGKGVLEIDAPLLAGLRQVSDAGGIRLQSVRKGDSGTATADGSSYGWQEHRLELVGGDQKFFHAPTRFVATGGVGQVVMTWKLPADRFDFRRLILRRASGSTPPASATDGTGIPLGGTPDGRSALGVTNTVGAGTYSYSLFAAYDDYTVNSAGVDAPITDTTSAGDKDFSAAISRAGVVVT